MAIDWLFDGDEDRGIFVYSGDPSIVEANSPEAIKAYVSNGRLADIDVPKGANRFHLEPVNPGPIASALAPALADVGSVEAMQRVAAGRPEGMPAMQWAELVQAAAPAQQAFETAKRAVVALSLTRVEGWDVSRDQYRATLDAICRHRPALGRELVAELYDRVVQISELSPEGK